MLARAFVNRVWAYPDGPRDCAAGGSDGFAASRRAIRNCWIGWPRFRASGYDVKRLVRNIVLFRSLSTGFQSWNRANAAPRRTPLPARLKSRCPPSNSPFAARGAGQDSRRQRAVRTPTNCARRSSRVSRICLLSDYNPSLQQALFLSNSPLMDGLLKTRPGNTTARLLALNYRRPRVQRPFGSCWAARPTGRAATMPEHF